MAEYIDREAARNELIRWCEVDNHGLTKSDVHAVMDGLPAADVVEVVHGEWIEDISVLGTTTGGATVYRGYQCSICGGLMGRKGDSYCYRCGAKMDGGAEE